MVRQRPLQSRACRFESGPDLSSCLRVKHAGVVVCPIIGIFSQNIKGEDAMNNAMFIEQLAGLLRQLEQKYAEEAAPIEQELARSPSGSRGSLSYRRGEPMTGRGREVKRTGEPRDRGSWIWNLLVRRGDVRRKKDLGV